MVPLNQWRTLVGGSTMAGCFAKIKKKTTTTGVDKVVVEEDLGVAVVVVYF